MKIEKIINTLVLMFICVLIIQIFLSVSITILCGQANAKIGFITSVLSVISGIVLSLFLSKLFELFTGRSFKEMYYRFYSFDKLNDLDNYDKKQDQK